MEHVAADNIRLQEKIRTFRFDTPMELEAAMGECSEVRSLAMNCENKGEDEIFLIAKTHYLSGYGNHPKGHTFERYLPHWLSAQGHRSDLYPVDTIKAMRKKYGKPRLINGKKLELGCTYVWVN